MACTDFADKPKNLIDREIMSDIILEIALNDQTISIDPTANTENGLRYIMKKHRVSSKNFTESYKYYTSTQKLESIIEDAQKKLLEKNPDSKVFVEKKLKENEKLPTFAR